MKYTKHNKKEFVKLTIRCDKEDLDKFKHICEISGLSANNQINIFIRKYIFENQSLLSTSSFSVQQNQSIIDFFEKK